MRELVQELEAAKEAAAADGNAGDGNAAASAAAVAMKVRLQQKTFIFCFL